MNKKVYKIISFNLIFNKLFIHFIIRVHNKGFLRKTLFYGQFTLNIHNLQTNILTFSSVIVYCVIHSFI